MVMFLFFFLSQKNWMRCCFTIVHLKIKQQTNTKLKKQKKKTIINIYRERRLFWWTRIVQWQQIKKKKQMCVGCCIVHFWVMFRGLGKAHGDASHPVCSLVTPFPFIFNFISYLGNCVLVCVEVPVTLHDFFVCIFFCFFFFLFSNIYHGFLEKYLCLFVKYCFFGKYCSIVDALENKIS